MAANAGADRPGSTRERLAIGRVGAALAAIVFALCGFQAVHGVHEPFYDLMLYLPLCLLLADRYAITGRLVWLAGLAIVGKPDHAGHFQIQMWTAGLVLVAGHWRALVGAGDIPRKLGRIAGLVVGLCWGAAVASVQLRLTLDLTGVSGFVRPPQPSPISCFRRPTGLDSPCRRCSSAVPWGRATSTGATRYDFR